MAHAFRSSNSDEVLTLPFGEGAALLAQQPGSVRFRDPLGHLAVGRGLDLRPSGHRRDSQRVMGLAVSLVWMFVFGIGVACLPNTAPAHPLVYARTRWPAGIRAAAAEGQDAASGAEQQRQAGSTGYSLRTLFLLAVARAFLGRSGKAPNASAPRWRTAGLQRKHSPRFADGVALPTSGNNSHRARSSAWPPGYSFRIVGSSLVGAVALRPRDPWCPARRAW